MSCKDIPNHHHVLRYCSPNKVQKNGKIAESAFYLSPDNDYLSVNWLEHFKVESINEQVQEIRNTVNKKLKLKKNGRFAKLNVGEIKNKINGSRVKHIPERNDPSHSGIYVHGEQNNEITLELAHIIVPDKDIFEAI